MKAAPGLILGKLEASFQASLPSPLVSHVSQWEAESVRTLKLEKCTSERSTAVKPADAVCVVSVYTSYYGKSLL